MNAAERRMEIFSLLQEKQSVEVQELANRFAVTTMTIRRDLSLFEKQGLITTSYGGAYLNKNSSVEPSFSIKSSQHLDKKQAIGKKAASYVQDGDTIVIDCGTTTMQLVKYLQGKRLTIITNSWPVANFLGDNPKIKLILAPGEYDAISAGTFGTATAEFFGRISADKVFIGTHGCSAERGATVPELSDAQMKRILLSSGREKFLMADSSKFGETYLAEHAKMEEFTHIITDSGLDRKKVEQLRKKCADVVIAGKRE